MSQLSENVKKMYMQHPFPPKSRRGTYTIYGEYLRKVFHHYRMNLEGTKILDAGCGTGAMLCDIAKEIPEASFTGIDFSPSSLEIAQRLAEDMGLENVRFLEDDLLDSNLNEKFDMIYSWGVLHHTTVPKVAFNKIINFLNDEGIIRVGVYGNYGNWERRIQHELFATLVPEEMNFNEKIEAVREWIEGERCFRNIFTEPAVDIKEDDWVVDEFLHVQEHHIHLRELTQWYTDAGIEIYQLTDYYNRKISLDIQSYSTNSNFITRVRGLSLLDQFQIIDLIARPYWLSLIGQKQAKQSLMSVSIS